MPKWVIAIFPSMPGAEDAIAALRQRFDPLAAQIPPHLTLVFPFGSDLGLAELGGHVAAVLRDFAPFPVRLAEITGSEREYLFLNVKRGNDDLITLHDALYTGPLRHHRSFADTFFPHLTVGRVPDPARFTAARAVVATTHVCVDTRVIEAHVPLGAASPT